MSSMFLIVGLCAGLLIVMTAHDPGALLSFAGMVERFSAACVQVMRIRALALRDGRAAYRRSHDWYRVNL